MVRSHFLFLALHARQAEGAGVYGDSVSVILHWIYKTGYKKDPGRKRVLIASSQAGPLRLRRLPSGVFSPVAATWRLRY
jgi:hypothetical protein